MKRLIYILLITCLLTSCDDWLDVTSTTEIKGESQFSSTDGFRNALIGAYIGMTDKNLYSRNMTWHFTDVLAQPFNPLSVSTEYSVVQDYNYTHKRVREIKDDIWKDQYNVICNINNALKFIDTKKDILNTIDYSVIKGELLGLRAFLHFDILRLFGLGNLAEREGYSEMLSIPYQTDCSKHIPKQLTYGNLFKQITQDMNEAENLLKKDPVTAGTEQDDFEMVNITGFYNMRENRMNYYALKALQARVYMWFGGIENINKAKECCLDITENSFAQMINPNLHDFGKDHRLYPEHLFNLEITDFASITEKFFTADSDLNQEALYFMPDILNGLYENDNPNIGLVDIRFTKLFKDDILGKVCNKYRTGGAYLYRNILPLIKLPEVYYMLAECYIQGQSQDIKKAVEYLNYVREHRGIIQMIPENINEEEALAELTKEYRKEFVCEGQLFFYYKRIGKELITLATGEKEMDDNIYRIPFPDTEIEIGNREQ